MSASLGQTVPDRAPWRPGPVGMIMGNAPVDGGWASLGALAREAEEHGVGAIWFTDHVFWHTPVADVTAALALVATATDRCAVGPLVLQLPLHLPARVAKSMSFIDHLANGRVIVGVGIGEHEAEYVAAGVGERYRRRGRLLDEGIVELRRAWAQAGDLTMAPARNLPVWVGGRSERARQRAATLAEGWIPHLTPLSWFAEQQDLLTADLETADRDPAQFTRGVGLVVAVEGTDADDAPLAWLSQTYRLPARVFAPVLLTGSAEQVADHVQAFRSAGADHVALWPASSRPVDHLIPIMEALGGR
ncbi:MAG: LLM class flavin-dependent oxidoreductase [Aquihabitans sp.]